MADQMNPINWFEIPVQEMARAKKNYEFIFNYELSLQEMGPLTMAWFPMYQGAPGATVALVKADAYTPSYAGTLVYFTVPDIEDVLKKVEKSGGKIINPKYSIGQHGFVAHFEDSEGNHRLAFDGVIGKRWTGQICTLNYGLTKI